MSEVMSDPHASAVAGDLHTLGVRALHEGYASGRFTPVDVIDALAARIEAWEPHIRALYAYRPEAARAQAEASAQRWKTSEQRGLLDGVPTTIKDLIDVQGLPSPLGCAATEARAAEKDAPPTARLREAGAILFAKTTMPDYGMLSSGLSSLHPLTRNPWDLRMNPGGSSAGAGAAAAARLGPLHLGTDIGGSIRLPAAWCGLVGLKPSLGRVPIDPYYTGRCAGPMTRSVDDAACMMAVLSRPDPRDATSLPPASIDWHAPPSPARGLKIGLMMDAGSGLDVESEIARAVRHAAELFAANGATVTPVRGVLTRAMLDGIDLFWRARASEDIARLPIERREKILPYIRDWAAPGEHAGGMDVVAGFNQTFAVRRACAKLFESVDAVIAPVSPTLHFPAANASPLDDPARPFEHIAFTLPWNMSEQPATSIPCGVSVSGFPIGLQIVAPRFADGFLLALARWFESALALKMHWPEPPEG